MIQHDLLIRIQRALAPWDNHNVTDKNEETQQDLYRLFNVPEGSISKFRWGQSAAPVGHPHYGCTWLTIRFGDVTFNGSKTLVVSPSGEVLETIVK